jgi:hypothetical protein
MSIIDISHLNIYDVILELWRNASPPTFLQNRPDLENLVHREPTIKDIDQTLSYESSYPHKYIHTLGCRFIETKFNDLKNVDTTAYNMRVGPNAFENIVNGLSYEGDVKEPEQE